MQSAGFERLVCCELIFRPRQLSDWCFLGVDVNTVVCSGFSCFRDLKCNEISWTIEDMNGPFSALDNLRKL